MMDIVRKIRNIATISNILINKIHDVRKTDDGVDIVIDRSVSIRIMGDVDVTLDGNFNIDTLPPYVINLNSRESIHIRNTEMALRYKISQLREIIDNIKTYDEYVERQNRIEERRYAESD